MTNKAVYKIHIDCGRSGDLSGLFIADPKHVEILLEQEIEVYFGEVLGKHSDIYSAIDSDKIKFISEDPSVIKVVEDFKLEVGINPFDFPPVEGNEFETVLDWVKSLAEKESK